MASALSPLLLKEDAELLSKVLRVGITSTAGDASARGGDPYLEMTDLAAELKSEVAELKLEADPTARWADVSMRRSLFDRALVGRRHALGKRRHHHRICAAAGREGDAAPVVAFLGGPL